MFKTLSIFNTIYNDAPQPWQIGFQDSAAPGFTGIVELHNTIFFYLIVICVGVFWVLGSSIYYFNIKNSPIIHKYLNHGKYVPIQKCSKFNNKNYLNQIYISVRTYTNFSNKKLENNIKVYENVFEMKKEILNENKDKSGIYMWTNNKTNEKYIGQSSNLSNRLRDYYNLKKTKKSLIYKAIEKYGYLQFSLTILEYCKKSKLFEREKYYIKNFNPQYNIAGRSINSKHTEEIKTKIIKPLKKVLDIKPFEDIKLKINTVNGNPVNIYEKFSSKGFKLIGSFVSARRAGKFLNISGSTIIKYKNSGEIFKDRYKFSSK
jgi:hypothetical protein